MNFCKALFAFTFTSLLLESLPLVFVPLNRAKVGFTPGTDPAIECIPTCGWAEGENADQYLSPPA